jgi:hypothetical protein
MFAEARFRTPWVDDEFAEAIRVARQWLRDNPSPDHSLGEHFVTKLKAYAEMTTATVPRVMELRGIIEREIRALELWNSAAAPPLNRRLATSTGGNPTPELPEGSGSAVPPVGKTFNSRGGWNALTSM